MRARAYIDGFNLYYGSLKGSPYRWLDVVALCKKILPQAQFDLIRYFTARTNSATQNIYLQALQAHGNVMIHEGQYRMRNKTGALVSGKGSATIRVPEEKGSDVNLAAWMLLDGFRGDYDAALIITNDSDLAEPIKMVHRDLKLKAFIAPPLNNSGRRMSQVLKKSTNLLRGIRQNALAASQLPAQVGKFSKPPHW